MRVHSRLIYTVQIYEKITVAHAEQKLRVIYTSYQLELECQRDYPAHMLDPEAQCSHLKTLDTSSLTNQPAPAELL